MRAAAWHDELTNPGGYWVRSELGPESIEVPEFTISERTDPTDEFSFDAIATEEVERQPLVALAPELEKPQPTTDELPPIDSGGLPRPSRAAEEASTGLFESMDWDEADPYTTGSFPSIPFDDEPEPEPEPEDRRPPSLAVVQSAPPAPEDADWSDHRATPLPVPPRPHRQANIWPPPRPAERARRPVDLGPEALAHVAAWESWDDWSGPEEDEGDTLFLDDPEPSGHGLGWWLALAFNASAFAMGFAATFLSGAVTLMTSALVLFALTL